MSARAQPDFHTLARSVGDYLARVAEPVAEGVRWATYSYAGERQYGTDVFAGAAGVVLFLADLAAMGDDARSRDLAERGMAWLAATWQREEAAGVYNPTL
ncbi:MAG: hypothetical protein FJ029_11585, partial [Actinobacteria bacterium]|nr:hypothetical protein [Actinomycetota bacterium]